MTLSRSVRFSASDSRTSILLTSNDPRIFELNLLESNSLQVKAFFSRLCWRLYSLSLDLALGVVVKVEQQSLVRLSLSLQHTPQQQTTKTTKPSNKSSIMAGIISGISNAISGILETILSFFQHILHFIWSIFETLFDLVRTIFATIGDVFVQITSFLTCEFRDIRKIL